MIPAMEPQHLLVALIPGAIAITFGLVPGLFGDLTLRVLNFSEAMWFGVPPRPPSLTEAERQQRPLGLAVAGAAVLAFAAAAYFSS
jgi:hypothetical protein